jgi:hypothetical protein
MNQEVWLLPWIFLEWSDCITFLRHLICLLYKHPRLINLLLSLQTAICAVELRIRRSSEMCPLQRVYDPTECLLKQLSLAPVSSRHD